MPWAAFFAAVVAFFRALLGGKGPDPETTEAHHEATIAQEQAAIVADHARPTAPDRMRDGSF